jgi:hypothetical protein
MGRQWKQASRGRNDAIETERKGAHLFAASRQAVRRSDRRGRRGCCCLLREWRGKRGEEQEASSEIDLQLKPMQ